MLCIRLNEILPDLIDLNQGAFVKHTSILHNVLLKQELLKVYDEIRISLRYVMKVDFKKAYGFISWDFLFELLTDLCFPENFIIWLRACVCTVHYVLKVNEDLHGNIKSQKGLRQGDPV